MQRPSYLSKYLFDWELMDVVISGQSAIDSKYFITKMSSVDKVEKFLKSYGFNPQDPIIRAELFGNFQEAIQFVKRYFLKEGNPDGLDLKIPNSLYMITDVNDLFMMATDKNRDVSKEERLWAECILKVMHTILHIDKDLRSNYFSVVQTQIFDRYYKYIYRNDNDQLFFGRKGEQEFVELVDFETKSKKSRDSVIIKLLHKAENVAEELFDRVGIRFVTKNKFDILKIVKFLLEENLVIPHNIKPSRSYNTIIDLNKLKNKYSKLVRDVIRNDKTEEEFVSSLEKIILESRPEDNDNINQHSSKNYHSVQFTCRHLIKHTNSFFNQFNELKKLAKSHEDHELAQKINSMDISLVEREAVFFYPYEIQIADGESHTENTEGDASHQEYKKSQTLSAMNRVMGPLKELHGISD